MIDVHSHLIPNVDDGAGSIEETFKLLKEAKQAGFTDIILTPHYMDSYYKVDFEIVSIWQEQLQQLINKEELNLKIYTGNEVYIAPNLVDEIKQGNLHTLAYSRYILVELPMDSNIKYLYNIIFNLKVLKLVPIIAHPERYTYIQSHIEEVNNLIEQGCLMQCNYGSIIGMYGRKSQKTIKKMLKNGQVFVLGSDCHKAETIYTNMDKIIMKLKKIISNDELNLLTEINPKKIIENN